MSAEGLSWPLNVPVLTDGVVTLRAHTPDDLEPMFEMANDPEMQRWTSVPVPNTRADTENFALTLIPQGWNDGSQAAWAIELADDSGRPRYAGNVDIRSMPIADIGFALHPWARGKGAMARAVRLANDWALTEGGVEIIHWRAHVGNEASLRVAHATGFTLHGTQPGLLHERGLVHDAWTASIRFGDSPVAKRPWAESTMLESERLRLRALTDADVDRSIEACSDPDSRQWLAGLPHPYTPAVARAYFADCVWQAATGRKATWAIADRDTDVMLGNIAAMDMNETQQGSAEIGYWLHPEARGQGVMKEAVAMVVKHAFDPQGLDRRRVTLYAAAGNAASNAIALANGFTHFGTQSAAERLGDGSLDDLVGYELTGPS